MRGITAVGISGKLTTMSVLSILLVAGILGVVLYGNAGVKYSYNFAMFEQNIVRDVMTIEVEVLKARMTMRSIRLAAKPEELEAANDLATIAKAARETFAELIPKFKVQANRDHTMEIQRAFMDYIDIAQKEIVPLKSRELALDRKDYGAIAALDAESQKIQHARLDPLAQKVMGGLHLVVENTTKLAVKTSTEAADQLSFATLQAGVIAGLVMLILIASAIFGAMAIARPLRRLVPALGEVAAGNFAVTMPGMARKDEVGQIAVAAQAIIGKVGAAIGNIKLAASEVSNASAEISTSTTDLSQRTEEQAASLEETSAAMEEIAATVRKNADNAREANQFASDTSVVAERGGEVVGEAVSAMARIEESSRKIVDIISVIDEIARQTNLLALNAAVEAARAGEAGRGFAVVASEVRSLAQRSSQAAKDIKDLITDSEVLVKDGVDLVNKAGASLTEIVASIKKVAAIVADIANASVEQSSGIEQVNKALAQMDEVTQQNSALVEENAATAKTLEDQARVMDERVAAFRLDESVPLEAEARSSAEASDANVVSLARKPQRARAA